MRIVDTFDPTTSTSSSFNAAFANGTGRIVVYNESNNNLLLSWGSFSTYCPAWTAMLYCISSSTVNINWQIQSALATAAVPPISQVIVEAYDAGEAITGTFPAPLMRQTNVGNVINTVGGTASAVQNDGNITGASVIEATVSGDSGSAASLTNNGHLILGTINNNGTFQLIGSIGNVTIDSSGKLTVDNRIIANLVIAEAGNDFAIDVATGNKIVLEVNNTPVVDINSSGLTMVTGKLSFVQGSLARTSIFSNSVNNAGTFVNHGLGAIPDAIFFTETNTGTDTNTFTYDPATMTNTQVKVWSAAGVTPRNFTAMAFKQ